MVKYSEIQTGGQGGKYIFELDGDGKPLTDEQGQPEKLYVKKCANYTSKTSGKTIFGCDQFIFWKTMQGKPSKLNLDGNPHICNHSNRDQQEKKKEQPNPPAPSPSPPIPLSKPSSPHLEVTKLQDSPTPSSIGNASNGKKPSEEPQEIRIKKGELIEMPKAELVDLYNEALIEMEKWRKIKMQIGRVLGLE